jgi:lysyl-tRNA synthetase class II
VVQRERFEAQVALIAAGDEEVMPLAEDFDDCDGVWNAAERRQGK